MIFLDDVDAPARVHRRTPRWPGVRATSPPSRSRRPSRGSSCARKLDAASARSARCAARAAVDERLCDLVLEGARCTSCSRRSRELLGKPCAVFDADNRRPPPRSPPEGADGIAAAPARVAERRPTRRSREALAAHDSSRAVRGRPDARLPACMHRHVVAPILVGRRALGTARGDGVQDPLRRRRHAHPAPRRDADRAPHVGTERRRGRGRLERRRLARRGAARRLRGRVGRARAGPSASASARRAARWWC